MKTFEIKVKLLGGKVSNLDNGEIGQIRTFHRRAHDWAHATLNLARDMRFWGIEFEFVD